MAELYYKALQRNEIRVLRSCSNNELNFELVHINLQSKPKYSALSYTWGALNFSHTITVDQTPCTVTSNLFDALEQLTNRQRSRSPLISKGGFLWVDAICIDQCNDAERSQQVQLMRSLYENSRKVYVWLGKPENENFNKLAVQKMLEFTKRFEMSMDEDLPYRPWWWPNKPMRMETTLYQGIADIPTYDKSVFDSEGSTTHSAWLGICDLWRKPWWSRTWVYQEATIPDNFTYYVVRGVGVKGRALKVVFLCGPCAFSWRDMNHTIMIANKLVMRPEIDADFLFDVWQPAGKLSQLLLARQTGQQSLLDLLQTFRSTECGDHRDKLYAPLGLATTQSIPIDYRLSLREVYLSLVQYMITESGHELDFLGYAAQTVDTDCPQPLPTSSTQNLPSWIPDWRVNLDIYPLPKRLYGPQRQGSRAIVPIDRRSRALHSDEVTMNCYNASAGAELEASMTASELHVTGVRCDVISDIREFDDIKQCRDTGRQWRSEAQGQYFLTGEPFADALKRVWAADVDCDTFGKSRSRNKYIDYAFLQKAQSGLTAEEVEIQENMKHAHKRATQMRNVCRTVNGFIGLVPVSAGVGDEVWVFLGGQVLYTLRPINDSVQNFTFIGECYLHGLMDGEIMQWVKDGAAKTESLVLI